MAASSPFAATETNHTETGSAVVFQLVQYRGPLSPSGNWLGTTHPFKVLNSLLILLIRVHWKLSCCALNRNFRFHLQTIGLKSVQQGKTCCGVQGAGSRLKSWKILVRSEMNTQAIRRMQHKGLNLLMIHCKQ